MHNALLLGQVYCLLDFTYYCIAYLCTILIIIRKLSIHSYEHVIQKLNLCLLQITSFEISASKRSGQTSPMLKALMVYLLKKVTCDKTFVQLVVSKSRFACPFFRLLMTVANPDLVATFLVIAKVLYNEASKITMAKPLAALLKDFIGKREHRDVTLLRSMARTDDPKKGKPLM